MSVPVELERQYRHFETEIRARHSKFCRESFRIHNKVGRLVDFIPQPAQVRLNDIIQRCREQGKPIRIIVLKARQVMVSMGVASEVMSEVPFTAGQHALIVAHDKDSAKNIFRYYHDLQTFYSPYGGIVGMDELVKDAEDAGALEWANGQWVHIASADNVKAGRSASIRFLHLSEFAFWRDARTLMTALMQSVPSDPDTMVVIESTANGVGGEFYQRWLEANDPASGSEWIPFFFAWWEHPEYSLRLDDPAGFEATLSKDERDLQQRYNLTLGQLAWRRWCIRNNCGGSVDTFKQEYPSCPEEAFLFSGRPRFSHQHLSRMPVDEHGLVGELEEVVDGPKRAVRLIPAAAGEPGFLTVYRRPAQNHHYTIGVDVCEGIDAGEGTLGSTDPDWSVADVFDRDSGEQVAQLRARLEPMPFADYVEVLARWYGSTIDGRPAYVVPEANGPGIAFIDELMRLGFPAEMIYHRVPTPDEQFSEDGRAVKAKLGWKTTTVTRPQLISKMDRAIRELSILLHNPGSVMECRTFVVKSEGRPEAMTGCHDDRVFSAALGGVVGIEQAPPDRRNQAVPGRHPPGESLRSAASTVRRYGLRRSEDRGALLKF